MTQKAANEVVKQTCDRIKTKIIYHYSSLMGEKYYKKSIIG
jgi:hypothetical protein